VAVTFQAADWSKEILRKKPGLVIDFEISKGGGQSVAFAHVDKDRSLTVNDIAVLSALESPRILPYALRVQISDCDHVVARLIADGLVEIRRGRDFTTGAAALGTADSQRGQQSATHSLVSDLALHYALSIRHLPVKFLADRVYSFNCLPQPIQDGDPEDQFIKITGIDIRTPKPKLGGHEWSLQTGKGWIYFNRGKSYKARYKLYVTPKPQVIPDVIPQFAEVLGRSRGSIFKVAFPAGSLGRADKIVAYFPSFEAIQETATALLRLRLDVPVQGIPFTARIPGTELFSWGVDPPRGSMPHGSSWRSWVARQVAECAQELPAHMAVPEAFDLIKMKLQLRQVDTVDWVPLQELVSRKWSLDI
jgi:hypothetical protein